MSLQRTLGLAHLPSPSLASWTAGGAWLHYWVFPSQSSASRQARSSTSRLVWMLCPMLPPWKMILIASCITCPHSLKFQKFISLPRNISFYRLSLAARGNGFSFRVSRSAQQSPAEYWWAQDQDGVPFFRNPWWVHLPNNQGTYEGPRHCVRWLLLRERSNGELDPQEEAHEPHDKLGSSFTGTDPKQDSENGHQSMARDASEVNLPTGIGYTVSDALQMIQNAKQPLQKQIKGKDRR